MRKYTGTDIEALTAFRLPFLAGASNLMLIVTPTGQVLSQAIPTGGTGGSVEWVDILNKPTEFVAAPHTHTAAQVTGLSTVATTGAYADLTGKPTIPAQFNPIAGSNITLTGTYPNITFASSGGGTSGTTYLSGADFAGLGTEVDPVRLANGNSFTDPGSSGILVRTVANTVITRSITGVANRISITNANGVNGHPLLDVGSDVTLNTATQTLTNKTLTSPKINVGTDAVGDMYFRNSSGVFTRIPAGAVDTLLKMGSGSVPSWQPISTILNTWNTIQRNTTTGRTSTTILVPDEQLQISVLAGYIYTIRLTVHFSANGGNFKFGFTGPSATVRAASRTVINSSITYGHLTAYDTSGQGITATGNGTTYMDIVLEPTASGTFSFTWAQTVSNTGPTNVHVGSMLEYFTGSNSL